MTPRQPYLIRALYDWILDNDATPYILVRVDDRTSVPADFVRDGQIVLNISPTAVRDLAIDDDWLGFDGRFSGRSFSVLVPVNCVCAIYARETGEGMIFDGELKDGGRRSEPAPDQAPSAALVADAEQLGRSDVDGSRGETSRGETSRGEPRRSDSGADTGEGGNGKKGPHLRVVK
ncbi:MAG: ClpXP protease specificity-enhancing factor [Pseudomonadota bacterium]